MPPTDKPTRTVENVSRSPFGNTRASRGPRLSPLRSEPVLLRAESPRITPSAESFYFQKQMQQHTALSIVLEDGERLTGTLEWFDDASLKIRCSNGSRVVVWKHGIRYLYKAGEENGSSQNG